MITEKILESLLEEILNEKSSLDRFKLLEQLELFARSISNLAANNILPTK